MEKTCEFCTALRPVVYCKADAAYLCLSCDAKVHSANALSHRHLRTLLCDSCRCRPAYARCWDHRMFLCHGCDQIVHGVSIQHQKQAVSSYMGSPSAKDFAALWGFELNKLSQVASLEPCGPGESSSQIGNSSVTSKVSSSGLVSSAQCEAGSSTQQTQISYKGQQEQDNCFILKQILDLKRLQLTKVNKVLPATPGQVQADISSSACSSLKELDNNLARSQHYQDLRSDLHQSASQLQELKVDSLPLTFSQVDHFPSSSSAASSLLGESFWQCKSPDNSSQNYLGIMMQSEGCLIMSMTHVSLLRRISLLATLIIEMLEQRRMFLLLHLLIRVNPFTRTKMTVLLTKYLIILEVQVLLRKFGHLIQPCHSLFQGLVLKDVVQNILIVDFHPMWQQVKFHVSHLIWKVHIQKLEKMQL